MIRDKTVQEVNKKACDIRNEPGQLSYTQLFFMLCFEMNVKSLTTQNHSFIYF